MLPEGASALLARTLPGARLAGLAATSGGYSHLSVAATLAGRPCVIKADERPLPRADLRREAAVLALLPGRGIAAPGLLTLAEDENWTVLVTARLPGTPGQQLYAGSLAAMPPAYRALGAALARVHSVAPPAAALPPDLDLAARARLAAGSLPALSLPGELSAALAAALAHPRWRPAAPRLTHGDAGLHNVLWDDGRLALLDWEWAGWADPLRDLAWLAWTLRFRGLPAALWAALLDGYRAVAPSPPADAAALSALALGQIADILRRASGAPSWEEWLRRAAWTVGLDFSSEAGLLGG